MAAGRRKRAAATVAAVAVVEPLLLADDEVEARGRRIGPELQARVSAGLQRCERRLGILVIGVYI